MPVWPVTCNVLPAGLSWRVTPCAGCQAGAAAVGQFKYRAIFKGRDAQRAPLSGPAIEVHAVATMIGRVDSRMAMHDKPVERPAVQQKVVADPDQIGLDLVLQGDSGPDPRMHEEQPVAFGIQWPCVQKFPM